MAAQADRCRRPAPLPEDAKESLPHPRAAKSAVNAKDRRRVTCFCGANLKHLERRDATPRREEARRYDTVRKQDDLLQGRQHRILIGYSFGNAAQRDVNSIERAKRASILYNK